MKVLKYNVVHRKFASVFPDDIDKSGEWHTIIQTRNDFESIAIQNFLIEQFKIYPDNKSFPRKLHLMRTAKLLQEYFYYLKTHNFCSE